MSKTARQVATGYRPSGRQCVECKHAAEDCSGIDFAAMPQAGKIDKDGVQRVRCMFYERAERVSAADELEHNCCGALANGPHKMGCDYRMHETPASMAAPIPIDTIRYWVDAYMHPAGDEHFMGHGMLVTIAAEYLAIREREIGKPCRCGGCADSVACQRGER